MNLTVTEPRFFDAPVTGPIDLFKATADRWALLRRHLDQITERIDATLRSAGWSPERTSFTDSEFARSLPVPALAGPSEQPTALRAFERIREMLDLDDQRTAALVGISRNTPRDWRHGNQPRSATTRRLYELVGVLNLVATSQPDMAVWVRSMSPEQRSWLQLAGEPEGPSAILAYLRGTLLTRRPPTHIGIDNDNDNEEESLDDEEMSLGDEGTGPASELVTRRQGPRRRAR
jgi:hypothetical protein